MNSEGVHILSMLFSVSSYLAIEALLRNFIGLSTMILGVVAS